MENINLAGEPIQPKNQNNNPAPAQNNNIPVNPTPIMDSSAQRPKNNMAKQPSEDVIFAVLSYIPFLNIVIFIIKDNDELIKFHARQGMIIFFIYILGFLPISFIDNIFLIVAVVFTLVGAAKAYKGEMYKLPGIYDLSTKLPF